MQRSLFTAISGLNNHQTKLDVIGNNIANVNTTAFKSGRVRFADILSQTLRGASAPQDNRGGINPLQVGLGMQLAAIDNNHTQGNLQSTGRELDMAIQGNGFFIISDGRQNYFTRDGSFARGADGFLVSSSNGFRVMGWLAADAGSIDISQPTGSLNIPLGFKSEARATESMVFGGNLNASLKPMTAAVATLRAGQAAEDSVFTVSVGDADGGSFGLAVDGVNIGPFPYNADTADLALAIESLGTPYAGNVTVINSGADWSITFAVDAIGAPVSLEFDADLEAGGVPGGQVGDGATTVTAGSMAVNELQQISVNNATGGTFTLSHNGQTTAPIAHKATAAGIRTALEGLTGINSGDVAVSGAIGGPWTVEFTGELAGTDAAELVVNTAGLQSSFPLEIDIYDSLGNVHTLHIEFEKAGVNQWTWQSFLKDGESKLGSGSGTIVFNEQGSVASGEQGTFTLNPIPAGSALVGSDPLSITLDFSALSQLVGGTDALLRQQDGFPMGILNAFNVGSTGIITGSYSNGMVVPLGQIALGRFENPEGLTKAGSNMFQPSANSGDVFIGTPGTQGRGKIETSTLEMSNVNIAFEFTEIITTSRAFQANSRIITSSDELLQEVVNLKR
ncbi:MAG: flagellar hook protein FlgE [Dethiobacter sp.]|jgi:flagellar hook protein FlgE|nr:flagellar hook protein FlgE [Dethiobacter sp.]